MSTGSHGPRVAHLVQYLRVGGLERMAASLAEESRRIGYRAELVAYLGDGPFRATVEARGVPTALLATGAGLQPSLTWRIAGWLRRNHIDVLHTHHLGPFLYGAPAAWQLGVAHVHTEHSHELYDTPRRRTIGRVLPHVARAVAVSEAVADFHARELGGRLAVIENGVSVPPRATDSERAAARARMGIAPSEHVVGCVARLAPEKRHDVLLEAFARSDVRATLVLVGDGPERASLEAWADGLGVRSRVRFLGEVASPEALLPGIDVVALASEREGLPMALLEAMAFGIPVIATAVGGVPTLLAEGGGLLVAPRDAEGLALGLRLLASDGEARARLGAMARARIEARYSAERMARSYARLYDEALAGRGARCA